MLFNISLLGVAGLISACWAVPTHIDLEHRSGPKHRAKYGIEPVTENEGFWFGQFDIGNSKNLSLLIDTGSSDIIINSPYYHTGPRSVNLGKNFSSSYGTTESDGSGTRSIAGRLYNDTVKFASATVYQTIGSASPAPDGANLIPANGIVGFSGSEVSNFNGPRPFFQSLCEQGQIEECRFGIALGSEGKGKQIIGTLAKSLYKGDLTTTSILFEWFFYADIALGGRIITRNAPVELDTGTANIIGPMKEVIAIFEASSIQYQVQTSNSSGTTVTGYFPCDKPPVWGLSIPSRQNATKAAREHSRLVSRQTSIFNIQPDQWIAVDHGNNNCTAILSGTDNLPVPNLWVVGQPFFHGLYVDHNLHDGTLGFAPAITPNASSELLESSQLDGYQQMS